MRGIGAATAWVFGQMQATAATSSGRMTVQKQTFVQRVSSRIPVPTTITNVIATLKGSASPERFYVITGHLDSRVTDVLNFTSDAPGADDDAWPPRPRPAFPCCRRSVAKTTAHRASWPGSSTRSPLST